MGSLDASWLHYSCRVHQAVGMTSAQASCDLRGAFTRFNIWTEAMRQTPDEFARDIIEGLVRIES
jgi:hypothetical protein